jgi:uncharacterized protein YggE
MPAETPNTAAKNKLNVSLDFRLVIAFLLVVIVAMLLIWKPWGTPSSDRTVSVTGQATLKAEPDEYIFYPNYQFSSANKDTALTELTKKSDQIVGELKKLGVANNKIKTNSGGYDLPIERKPDSEVATYTLSLTVTATDKEQAQKVQDYLVTTSPTGSVSPQAGFSTTMRKSLESKARDQATKDAREKADQSAKNLGFKVGKVKSVSDGTGFGDVIPLGRGYSGATEPAIAEDSQQQLTVQPGENELSYSVTVVYYVK